MRHWLLLLALLPNCTGCLAYAYPWPTYTPEIPVDNKDGSAHAFRIDIDRTEHKPAPTTTQYTLSQIPIDSRGLVPSQFEVGATTGVLNPLGVVDGSPHERSQYTMLIRLYRPGFQTQEVQAWEKARQLLWSPASDLLAQEKAIDDLLAVPASPDGPVRGSWWEFKDQKTLGLEPGTVSRIHREALLFASGEYQRLAGSPNAGSPANQAMRERLTAKALWLRRYADSAP